MSLSCLTCNLVARRDDDPFSSPQPQTATACSAVKRSCSKGLTPPRYAPLCSQSSLEADRESSKRKTRKCKSAVVDVSQLAEREPQLKRSGGVRRDWSFEDLRNQNLHNEV